MKRERWVLKSRKTGRQAPMPDQGDWAIQLEATRLTRIGSASGIVPLFLPVSAAEDAKLVRIMKSYRAERASARPGDTVNSPSRASARDAVTQGSLIPELAARFAQSLGGKPGPQAASVKAFVRWVMNSFSNKGSDAYRAANQHSPNELGDLCCRGERWWADRLKARRKTQS